MAADLDIPPARAAALMDDLTKIVARAASVIRDFSPDTVGRQIKADQSPVTAADEAAEAAILEGLAALLPGVPAVSEEKSGREAAPALGGCFLMADPLDGTKEFLAGRDEFTVNLAVVRGGTPIAGIIAAPARGQVWRGVTGHGAERLRLTDDGADRPQAIKTRAWPAAGGVAVVSRSHLDSDTEAFLKRLGPLTPMPSGSAIKFCQVADATADVYPRLATTCEWDVAAGHALIAAAGGVVTDPHGAALTYGHVEKNFRIPAFIAWGDAAKAKSV
ncbi:MAG: inositol monophosphatase family protein [Pseudolabrys sp.]